MLLDQLMSVTSQFASAVPVSCQGPCWVWYYCPMRQFVRQRTVRTYIHLLQWRDRQYWSTTGRAYYLLAETHAVCQYWTGGMGLITYQRRTVQWTAPSSQNNLSHYNGQILVPPSKNRARIANLLSERKSTRTSHLRKHRLCHSSLFER